MSSNTVIAAAAFKPRPATLADLDGICNLYFSAFAGSYILENCFPRSSQEVQEFVKASRKENLEDLSNVAFVIPDEDGNVIASATWERPRNPENHATAAATTAATAGEKGEKEVPWPKDGNPELAAAFFGGLQKKNREIMGDRPHWLLHLIMVLPEHQGKGLSTQLMNWGLKRAREDGLPIYLDATPRAKAVYERFGFKVVDTLTFGDGILTEYMMVKD